MEDDGTASGMYGAILTYKLSLTAYRSFYSQMQAHLTEMSLREPEEYELLMRPIISQMSPEERTGLADLFTDVAQIVAENPTRRVSALPEMPALLSRHKPEFLTDRALPLLQTMMEHIPTTRHKELLYRGILTGLVGQFEVLIADMAGAFYKRAPKAIGSDEKVLSVSELRSFRSIEEALESVIESKVEDLLRGSIWDWQKFFQTRMKVELADCANDWNFFVEYIQRRHLIVHTGGDISRRYLDNVDPILVKAYFGEAKIGQRARIDAEYINAALDAFELTGLLFAYTCWAKLSPSEIAMVETEADQHVYRLMLRQDWVSARAMAQWGMRQEKASTSFQTIAKVNFWLASKELGDWRAIESEVRSFDCSALRPTFALARAALLEDSDSFFAIIDETEGAQLDGRAWREWPIFAPMRRDSRFDVYRNRYLPEHDLDEQ